MGFMTAMGSCFGCGRLFSFNPDRVPSITPPGGTREPVCKDCVARANVIRAKNGAPLIVPVPGAYEPEEV